MNIITIYQPVSGQSLTLKATQLKKAKEGIHPASLPIGYHPFCLVAMPDKQRAPYITQAIQYAADGWTLARIKHYLDEAGFTNKNGKPASLDMIGDMVKNPFYAGFIRWNGKLYPGKHESIVPLALIQEAERQLVKKRRGGGIVRVKSSFSVIS